MIRKLFATALIPFLAATLGYGQQKFVTIATGGTAGTYFPLGGALAEIWNKNLNGVDVTAAATGASVANVALLARGDVDVIFLQNDIAFYALNGIELFERKKLPSIRGMATLYSETVQLVALADARIRTVADLKGKRVSVGSAGSGVELNARQVLEAAGLGYDDIDAQYLSFAEASSNLKDGSLDAAFNTAGAPTTAIQDLAIASNCVLVPVDGAVAARLMKKWPFYTAEKLPANTYKGIPTDTMTVAVKSMLAVSSKADPQLVYDLLRTMYANGDRLVAAHKKGADIKLETSLEGMSIPLHPGAEKFFKENKK